MAGPGPLLWGPTASLNLQNAIQIGRGNAILNSGNVNPASTATDGSLGDLYVSTLTGKTYQKQDSGTTTNWDVLESSAGGVLPIASGGTGVSSVTTTPTASAFAGWDASSNLRSNAFIPNLTNVASAAGLTVLLVTSSEVQRTTGVTTQSYRLPNATTLNNGRRFEFRNASTGTITITLNDTTTNVTVPGGGGVICEVADNSTSNGTWSNRFMMPANASYGTSGMAITGTLSASSTVNFASLTASQVVITDSSKNLASLAYSSTAAASTLAQWDTNSNLQAVNFFQSLTSISASTTITVATANTVFLTGSTASQALTLPVATTFPKNGCGYMVMNTSTKSWNVLTSGGNTLCAVPSMGWVLVQCINTAGGTGTASWNVMLFTNVPTANQAVQWDANLNLIANLYAMGYLTVVGASGTTTLTASSASFITVSGATTQNIRMPDATTLKTGSVYFIQGFVANSITIQDAGGSTIRACQFCILILTDNSTTNGTWDSGFFGVNSNTGSSVVTRSNSGAVAVGALSATSIASSGAATATSFVATGRVGANRYTEGYTTTVTAAGTTTLTSSSTQDQVFSGSSTQNCQLPDATTLNIGDVFFITYTTSGAGTSSVKDGGGSTTIFSCARYGFVRCVCTSISTTAGTWDVSFQGKSLIGSPQPNTVLCTDSSNVSYAGTYSAQTQMNSPAFVSTVSNPATAGLLRLASTDGIDWRDNANGANLPLAKNTSDNLTWPNSFVAAGNLAAGQSSITASTTLTVASPYTIFISGTTASQSVTMPVATTFSQNGTMYMIMNTSTQSWNVLSSGGNTLCTIPSMGWAYVQCINTAGGTGTASWNVMLSTNVPTANQVAQWDSNLNMIANLYAMGYQTAATGGTLVLTASSAPFISITGTGAETIRLPDATTLKTGSCYFISGLTSTATLTLQNTGAGVLKQNSPFIIAILTNNSTANGTWDVSIAGTTTVTAGMVCRNQTGGISVNAATIGATSSASGALSMIGFTSGTVTVQVQAIAGTFNYNLPISAGSAGDLLTSQAGGSTAMTWSTPFASAISQGVTTLTDASTIALDFSKANLKVVLGGNRTLGVPTNMLAGARGQIFCYQDGTGTRTLAYSWPFQFAGAVAPVLSTGKYQVDMLKFIVQSYSTLTVTMTIATPCVVTWTAHGFSSGQVIQLTTTGALPTGLAASTSYWVNVIDANTFNLSSSLTNLQLGTYIASSGSQSGVHTGVQASIVIQSVLAVA